MRLGHVAHVLLFSPWSGREAWQSAFAVARPHLLEGVALPEPKQRGPGYELSDNCEIQEVQSEATDFFGNLLPKLEILPTGVAIVPIQGTLIHKATLMDKQCGACSYQDIKDNITEAIDKGASKIVLNVDSPGGMSMGASETGRFVARMTDFVRIEAVTDGLMCSAAYEVCAAAHKIYATPTSQVGSIGTFLAWLDETVRYEMAGLKMDVIASGPLKGAGVTGTSLTPEQRAEFQRQVNKFAGMFKDHVSAHRPLVEEHSMQGQSFIGDDAEAVGLVDEIIEDVEEVFE